MSDKKSFLYLYITPQHLDILRNARLHFRAVNDFCDPFEQNIRTLKTQELIISDNEFEAEVKRQFDNLPKSVAGLMQWQDFKVETLKNREKIEKQIIKQRKDKLGRLPSTASFEQLMRLSLFKRADNPLLWEKYAANHTGMVLELNLHHKCFTQYKKIVKPINYSGSRPKQVEGSFAPALFSKAPEYAAEGEVAFVVPQKQASSSADAGDKKVFFLNFHPGAIVSVILGANISKETKEQLDRIMQYDMKYKPGKPLKQVFLDRNSYKLHLSPTL